MNKLETWRCPKCKVELNKNTVLNITGMLICPLCATRQPDNPTETKA